MKVYNEQDHREALRLRRLKFLLSYPTPPIQSLLNKKAFREVILEELRDPPGGAMKKSKDYDDWLCSLVKADCWRPFASGRSAAGPPSDVRQRSGRKVTGSARENCHLGRGSRSMMPLRMAKMAA